MQDAETPNLGVFTMTMTLYKNKFRIESARLKAWDYSTPGCYFITICTKNREPYFGKIEDGEMYLSDIGAIAENFWKEIPKHFPNIQLDESVIMPDHIHGILFITDASSDDDVETPNLGVSTTPPTPPSTSTSLASKKTIGIIINQFKRICTIHSRKINPDFGWQSRFYDRIVRNEKELDRIRKYIIDNPGSFQNEAA
ncbi:MAG TPA: hypothetical protein PL169_14040 [Leptospiraceae bacterium]|nr:hypothetical protein [Leptospiraceae bacterium]